MALPSKTFAQFIADMQLQWQNALGNAIALQPGDVVLALMEAVSSQLVFLQALAQLINAVARAQTSIGADLDSFFAQFSFSRLPATFNTGSVVFTKLTPAPNQILIPVGTIVQTPGGAAQYQVVADTTQPGWSVTLGAYVLPLNGTSVTATVQALVAGTLSGVAAGQLSQLASSLPGIDSVTNPSAINNGLNAETDIAYRARFVLFINSLSKATMAAIQSAILNTQQGISYELIENTGVNGVVGASPGSFVAVIDDGSGSPPTSLLTNVFNALELVRGFTILPGVQAPSIVVNVRIASGFAPNVVTAAVNAAIVAAVNAIEMGAGTAIFIEKNIEDAADTVPGVVSVQPGTTLINGVNADFLLTPYQEPRITSANVTVGTY